MKRDGNTVLRKEHCWLSHCHQFSTIPLFSVKAFYSRTAQLHFFVIWQTCNTQEKKRSSSHDPEHSPSWVLRPGHVSRVMLGTSGGHGPARPLHPPAWSPSPLGRAGEQFSEQHLQLWWVHSSFTPAKGQLLANGIVCQARGGHQWSGHIPLRARVQPGCWVVVPVPLQGILTWITSARLCRVCLLPCITESLS